MGTVRFLISARGEVSVFGSQALSVRAADPARARTAGLRRVELKTSRGSAFYDLATDRPLYKVANGSYRPAPDPLSYTIKPGRTASVALVDDSSEPIRLSVDMHYGAYPNAIDFDDGLEGYREDPGVDVLREDNPHGFLWLGFGSHFTPLNGALVGRTDQPDVPSLALPPDRWFSTEIILDNEDSVCVRTAEGRFGMLDPVPPAGPDDFRVMPAHSWQTSPEG
ncbi:hypothetical protein AB0M95_17410 [Sphaerisporangium sp. NPDC051017]|uniref:hypothetical protein n=1 Tax=Sphaerisporangium sp. NPDC051017 TaxID=3154636 RepID=UPI0034284DC4